MNLAEALAIVEASPDHRILRRIMPWQNAPLPEGVGTHLALYVDCETTGLDHATAEIIELGMLPFRYDEGGNVVEVLEPFHAYNQPATPITPEITKLTGITNEMVAGKQIDPDEVGRFAVLHGLVVAHNAAFDRPFFEALCPEFVRHPWACSMAQVPWEECGFAGRRLEYVAAALGFFYDAHNAVADCQAGLRCLATPLLGDPPRTGLSLLLERARMEASRVWAIGAPFEKKDVLKARGYQWNGGEDGRPKAWHKEILPADLEAEKAFLGAEIYQRPNTPVRIVPVTARDRFTVRG